MDLSDAKNKSGMGAAGVMRNAVGVQIDGVFHLAAMSGVGGTVEDVVRDNIIATHNVACYCSERQTPIVFASSGAVYHSSIGEPDKEIACKSPHWSWYGHSKLLGEMMLHSPFAICRFSNVYGVQPKPKAVVGMWLDCLARGKLNIPVNGSGEARRDFIHVWDVVRGLYAAMLNVAKNPTVDLCTGYRTSVNNLFDILNGLSRNSLGIINNNKSEGAMSASSSPKSAKDILGWEAKISLKDGLRATMISMGIEVVS
jgi:UDP-glucose 4-epimerase